MTRKVSASMRALIERINDLDADNEMFKASRNERRSRDKKIAKRQLGKKRQSSKR